MHNRQGFDAHLRLTQSASPPKIVSKPSSGPAKTKTSLKSNKPKTKAARRRMREAKALLKSSQRAGKMSASPEKKGSKRSLSGSSQSSASQTKKRKTAQAALLTPSPTPVIVNMTGADEHEDDESMLTSLPSVRSRSHSVYTVSDDGAADGGADRQQSEELPEGEYVVQRLLARSLDKAPVGYGGKMEYRYLVRWEGWGQAGDTWEPRAMLLDGAKQALKDLESKGQCSESVPRSSG